MTLNGKDIIIFDYLIKPYSSRFEPGYNREIRVYVENNIRKQFEDKIVSGENELIIDNITYITKYHGYMGGGTHSNKKIYLFLIKE